MAEGVRLDLQVGLDTAYLRNQLNTIGTKLGGQAVTLPIIFDRRDIVTKTKALEKYIGGKKFNIEINTNLGAEVDNARRLASELAKVQQVAQGAKGAFPIGIGGLGTKKTRPDQPTANEIKQLYEALAIAGVEGFERGTKKNRATMVAEIGAVSKDVITGLLNGLSSSNSQLQEAARSLGETLIKSIKRVLGIASPSIVFFNIGKETGAGFENGGVQSLDKAFDAMERKIQERLRKLQALMQGGASRRGAFPFVAKTGPIEERELIAESMRIGAEIDTLYQQLAQVKQQRQAARESNLVFQQAALRQQAGRLLPAGVSPLATAGPTAQEQVVRQFYDSLRLGEQTIRRYFSANSYLPKASRELARAMEEAQTGLKMLSSAKTPAIAGLLPAAGQSSALYAAVRKGIERKIEQQMQGLLLPAAGETEKRKFRDAIAKAARIDAENNARYQAQQARAQARQSLIATRSAMSRLALPAAGETGAAKSMARTLGAQQFRAPSLAPRKEIDESGPIQDRLRRAAISFAKNAPIVEQYLNSFQSAANTLKGNALKIGDLPQAGESVGQYIRRIQQKMKEGPFGAGTDVRRQEFFQPGRGPQVPGMPVQLRLPPAGGTGGGDRVRGVGQPPERGGALAFVGATKLPENYLENMKRLKTATEVARSSLKNFSRDQLPLIGGLRGLAGEFGMAAKQVLLYGTAYKGLAFITSLPGQILNAAKGQQQFANSMQVATDKTKTFSKEMLFVDNIQRAYGLNLDTTRQGFVRLFASMAPSGFDSGSIEKLFTGISAATAALQLTPDKAERVIYAFGQMASKGQVMSEELKGQLGDVLPGALSIFADAAGKSISEFNKDLEDGVYQGEKFRELMAKVTDELIDRFGTGAQIAGRSLQGILNTVQGDFQRTLEAFSPLANAAAQAILTPIGGALRQLSMSAQLATGEVDRVKKQLEDQQKIVSDLKIGGADADQIRAAEQNVAALQARLEMLNEAAKDPAIQKQAQDIQRFTQELAKAGTFVMNVAQTIGSILSPVLSFLGGNLTTVIALVTSVSLGFQAMRLAAMVAMGALVAFRAVTAALGLTETARSATAVAAALKMLGINASGATVQTVGTTTALRALAAATVIGAVVTGITLIASAFLSMRDSANQAKKAAVESLKASREAALSGNVLAVEAQLTETRAKQLSLRDFEKALEKQKASGNQPPSQELIKAAQDAGIVLRRTGGSRARAAVVDLSKATSDLNTQFKLNNQLYSEQQKNREKALQRQKQLGLNQPTPSLAETVTPSTDTAKPKKGKAARESRVPLLELELATAEQIMEIERQMMTARLSGNELEVIRLEGLKEQVKINEQIAKIKLDKQTPAEEKSLQIQKLLREGDQARLKTSFELEKKIAETLAQIRERTVGIKKAAEEELADKKKYDRLVAEGILPSVAKITVEVERQFAIEQEKLELLRKDIERQISLLEKQKEATKDAEKRLKIEEELAKLKRDRDTVTGEIGTLPSMSAETIQATVAAQAEKPVDYLQDAIDETTKNLERLTDARYQAVEAANAIGDAFGNAFKGLITGSMTAQEALASLFQSVADSFADMVAQMIAEWIKMQILGIFKQLFSFLSPGASAPGLNFEDMAKYSKFANGGIAPGGFKKFATGGIVTGPTLGLVGEGRYNEAIVPLPDGKSIPVDLGGAASNQIVSNITVNVNNGQAQSNANGSNSSELGRKLEGAVKQVIVGELRPGGILAGRR